ncbi:MAG TPA: sigma-70 family RNA polymerase sigma factor [Planctomycetota bacterium]|nr:sigma-70 family RNA polymerase sigma factor [Planctomycetota bacterium]
MSPLGEKRAGDTSLGGSQKDFPKTAWELIAGPGRAGLEELCRRYWKPVYHYLRVGWARSNEDAKDLTQAFFLWLVEEELVKRYEPGRAAFRTYLKSLLKHFVQDHDKAAHRLKRGGGLRMLGLDEAVPDSKSTDPEQAFDQAWLAELMGRAVDRVRERFRSSGREAQVRVFEEYNLSPSGDRPTYAALAEKLGLKEGDVKNHLFAVREEIRKEIRDELSRMTAGPRELEEEWNAFFGA